MPSVLIVDDSPMDQALVTGILKRQTDWELKTATDGQAALRVMELDPADVVVTDMQMPEMDGLELVRALRVHFSDIPVILMTGQGSEALAVEALQEGAVSYVPKSKINEMLPTAVEQVSAMMSADRSYEKLIACMTRNEFTFELTNDPELIDPLVDLVQQMTEGLGLCNSIDRVRVGVALEHALLNALYRGNLEITAEDFEQASEQLLQGGENVIEQRAQEAPYSQRTIHVDVEITSEQATFVVRDQGNGFDQSVPADDGLAIEQGAGRGLVLMRTFMDEVKFNDKGNEVSMTKRRSSN